MQTSAKNKLSRANNEPNSDRKSIRIFLFCFVWLIEFSASAQNIWFVQFAEKDWKEIPAEYCFDEKALERRVIEGIPFPQLSDLPPDSEKIEAVEKLGGKSRYVLCWLNGISIECNSEVAKQIAGFSFVKQVIPLGTSVLEISSTQEDTSPFKKNLLRMQRSQMNLDRFVTESLNGKGVRIAIFDAGFSEANTHPGLSHIFDKGKLIEQKDFYSNKSDVFFHSSHGTNVLGCIAGYYEGNFPIGAAQEAEFLLARTEHNIHEKPIEEDHWMAAMEWADRKGADIISSSLGYSGKRHPYAQMDGATTLVTQAARIATSKGILVVNAAGNEGGGKFHYLSAPADADSILTVGGTMPNLKLHIKFSSFGPNAAGKMKPDVCAPAYVLTTGKKAEYEVVPGTSFSTPLVAGFAACVKQLHPEWKAAELWEAVRQSGHLYPYFDYAHGFGVPDAGSFFGDSVTHLPTFTTLTRNDSIFVLPDPRVLFSDTSDNKNGKVLYYHVADHSGDLIAYNFDLVKPGTIAYFIPGETRRKGILRIWFEGYLLEMKKL